MGGMQDKRQEPGKGREEQARQIDEQDPVHSEPSTPSLPSRGKHPARRKGSRKDDTARERDEGV